MTSRWTNICRHRKCKCSLFPISLLALPFRYGTAVNESQLKSFKKTSSMLKAFLKDFSWGRPRRPMCPERTWRPRSPGRPRGPRGPRGPRYPRRPGRPKRPKRPEIPQRPGRPKRPNNTESQLIRCYHYESPIPTETFRSNNLKRRPINGRGPKGIPCEMCGNCFASASELRRSRTMTMTESPTYLTKS